MYILKCRKPYHPLRQTTTTTVYSIQSHSHQLLLHSCYGKSCTTPVHESRASYESSHNTLTQKVYIFRGNYGIQQRIELNILQVRTQHIIHASTDKQHRVINPASNIVYNQRRVTGVPYHIGSPYESTYTLEGKYSVGFIFHIYQEENRIVTQMRWVINFD